MSMLLLAQLIAPPLQQGPVRLPEQRPALERPAPQQPDISPPIEVEPAPTDPQPQQAAPKPESEKPPEPVPLSDLPQIEGLTVYSPEQLRTILAACIQLVDPAQRLEACAAALTARFVADGYVNSRVFVEATPAPGRLEVVEGRLVELRISGNDAWLNRRVARLMRSLQGQVLHLPTIEYNLRLLRRVPGVKEARGNLSRLGSDPTQATLLLVLEGGAPLWQGDLSLRNDGSNGSGEARATATFVKPGALTSGDTLLLYGELNSNDKPELGLALGSLTYSLPLGNAVNFTASLGGSRRELIELPAPANDFSTNQIQGLGQFEWVFSESLSQRWSAFVGFSGSSSRTRLGGGDLPPGTPEISENPKTGYVRLGLSGSGQSPRVGWGGTAYVLNGIAGVIPSSQRQEWRAAGVDPSQATAIGGVISATWALAPDWQLNGRLAGQWAINPLLTSMQFSLGSDVGLRGLPGQLISGDSGWLAVTEASWTIWRNPRNVLQLVPFVGAGGVRTEIGNISFSDTVGSTGLLLRWLAGQHWGFELGYVHQFSTNDNPGAWSDWLLDNGLYIEAQFRF